MGSRGGVGRRWGGAEGPRPRRSNGLACKFDESFDTAGRSGRSAWEKEEELPRDREIDRRNGCSSVKDGSTMGVDG